MYCISCGMPLINIEDHALEDVTKDYCVHCSNADGVLKSFEEAVESMSTFLKETKNLNEKEAEKEAKRHLLQQPAWDNYKE